MQNIFSFVKNSSLLSLRGFEKSEVIHSIYNFFKNWIATPLLRSARNDNYFYSSLRGFAEAIKFTFDSLSRKIKIPCLVIKKFKSIKEIFKMKILKTKKLFTYIVVGALSLALSVSCSNEDTTGGGVDEELVQTNHNHPPAGIYYESGNTNWGAHTVTHNGGTCTIAGKVYPINGNNGLDYEVTITNWLNRPNSILPNLNYLGEYTIIKPESSIPFSSFDVKYDTTAETISVSLWSTSDGKFYSSLDLKRVE